MGNPIKWTAAFANPISLNSPRPLEWRPGAPPGTNQLSSTATPAVANIYDYNVWFMHNDASGGHQMWSSKYNNSIGWNGDYTVDNNWTNDTPTLIGYNNRLWSVYTGTNDSRGGNLYFTTSDGGMSWDGATQIPGNHVISGPSLAVNGNSLYCAYRGDTDNGIWIISNSGEGWSNAIQIPGATTSSGPAIAFDADGFCYCVYRGMDNSFNCMWSGAPGDPAYWAGGITGPGQGIDCQPSICLVPGQNGNTDKMLCVFGAQNSNDKFYYTTMVPDSFVWSSAQTIPNLSRANSTGMGIAVWNDIIFGAYMASS